MSEKKLQFNVLNWDMSSNKPVMFNVFDNCRVRESVEEEVLNYLTNPEGYACFDSDEKKLTGYEALKHKIDSIIRWQEWGRCEYEIEVGNFFSDKTHKIDCYFQAQANMDLITKMCIDYFIGEID